MPQDHESVEQDWEIVRRMTGRDSEGLRQLLITHGGRVKWCLTRELGGALGDSDIDEAINTAAYKIWAAAPSFDGRKGTLRAWFYAIARNAAIGIIRRDESQIGPTTGEDVDAATVSAFREAAEHATSEAHARFLDSLRVCIANLPPKQRAIIQADLRSGDVADAGQLAEELNTTKNSIYASRSIARKTLKKALGKLGYFAEEPDPQAEQT